MQGGGIRLVIRYLCYSQYVKKRSELKLRFFTKIWVLSVGGIEHATHRNRKAQGNKYSNGEVEGPFFIKNHDVV